MPTNVRISELLNDLAAQTTGTVTLRDVLDEFGERAIATLCVVFAAPLVLPMPPGVSAVLGLPLLLFTAQLTIGSQRPWLPRFLGHRILHRKDTAGLAKRILPLVLRMEKLLRPRLTWLLFPLARRAVGLVAFLLAAIVFLPIPFGNMFPSMAIAVLGLGLVVRDGLAVLVGWLVAVAAIAFLAVISHALLAAVVTFFRVLAEPFVR